MSTPNRYRRIIAYILVPEGWVNPLCPASDLQGILDGNAVPDMDAGAFSVYRAAFADSDIWTEDGECIEYHEPEGVVHTMWGGIRTEPPIG